MTYLLVRLSYNQLDTASMSSIQLYNSSESEDGRDG
jgi:hypothetical protein